MNRALIRNAIVALSLIVLIPAFISNTVAVESRDGILVGAYYYIWWGFPSPYENHWIQNMSFTPILGEYNSSNPLVAEQHIVLAKQYGIDFFAISWLGHWERYDFNYINEHNLRDGFLNATNLDDIRFCLFYESEIVLKETLRDNDTDFQQVFIDDMTYAALNYLSHSNYLKIEGKPVLVLHNLRSIYANLGPIETWDLLDSLREQVNIYLVGDVGSNPSVPSVHSELLYSMNAVTSYLYSDVSKGWQSILSDADSYYPQWRSTLNSKEISFIPNVYSGYDNTANEPNGVALSPDKNMFEKILNIAFCNADNYSKAVMITSWNEWLESTSVEPSVEHGETFLQAISNTRENYNCNQHLNLIYLVIPIVFGIVTAVIFYLYLRRKRKI